MKLRSNFSSMSASGMQPGASSRLGPHVNRRKVLVTVGRGASVSALGRKEAHTAGMVRHESKEAHDLFVAHSGVDKKLLKIDPRSPAHNPIFLRSDGTQVSPAQFASENPDLLQGTGIRKNNKPTFIPSVPTELGAPLAHQLESGSQEGGLRDLAGLKAEDFENSPFKDMSRLFADDPDLGPSLQSQMFVYSCLLALSGLNTPLSSAVSAAYRFRIAAGACFFGQESYEAMKRKKVDKFANRLASTLMTHGPALVNMLLAPIVPLKIIKENPEKAVEMLTMPGHDFFNVPQAPLVSSGACASALLTFADIAPLLLFDYPGAQQTDAILLTSADAAMLPDGSVLNGFGPGTMITPDKLDKLEKSGRSASEALAPFDQQAVGTIVGHYGGAVVITTLDRALRNKWDITSIITGWGQSGENGGKIHSAGVGMGGENALAHALNMSYLAHGFGLEEYGWHAVHGTGTSTNSATDLSSTTRARRMAAKIQKFLADLTEMVLSTPKAAGPGHPMGPAGYLAMEQAIRYCLGLPAVGTPSFRTLDPEIENQAKGYVFDPKPSVNRNGKGASAAVQGFDGVDAAYTSMPAEDELIARYPGGGDPEEDKRVLSEYLEARQEIRDAGEASEAYWSRVEKPALQLAELHRWKER